MHEHISLHCFFLLELHVFGNIEDSRLLFSLCVSDPVHRDSHRNAKESSRDSSGPQTNHSVQTEGGSLSLEHALCVGGGTDSGSGSHNKVSMLD